MILIAVDPGIDGAFAVSTETRMCGVWDLPSREISKTARVKRALDAPLLAAEWAPYSGCAVRVVVESVGARPGQGVAGMFSLGRTLGAIEGVAAGMGFPVYYILPQTWKVATGLLRATKQDSLLRARIIFPDLANKRLHQAGHHNRAEALLINHYWRQHGTR